MRRVAVIRGACLRRVRGRGLLLVVFLGLVVRLLLLATALLLVEAITHPTQRLLEGRTASPDPVSDSLAYLLEPHRQGLTHVVNRQSRNATLLTDPGPAAAPPPTARAHARAPTWRPWRVRDVPQGVKGRRYGARLALQSSVQEAPDTLTQVTDKPSRAVPRGSKSSSVVSGSLRKRSSATTALSRSLARCSTRAGASPGRCGGARAGKGRRRARSDRRLARRLRISADNHNGRAAQQRPGPAPAPGGGS